MSTKARTLGSAVSAGGVIQRDGAVKSYSSVNDLPLSGNNIGDTAYVSNFSRVYMWTGAGWFSIALINQNPAFDSGGAPEASYTLDSAGGTPTVIQLSASDPEGIPIQWSYIASDSAQYFATINQDSSVFTITAKDTATIQQYDSSGGTFSITFRASDGINLATALSEFTIGFAAPSGGVLFTTVGQHTWTVPDGVTSVCVVCIGAGGGNDDTSTTHPSGSGNAQILTAAHSWFKSTNDLIAQGGRSSFRGGQGGTAGGTLLTQGYSGGLSPGSNSQLGGGGGAAGYGGNGGNGVLSYGVPLGGGGVGVYGGDPSAGGAGGGNGDTGTAPGVNGGTNGGAGQSGWNLVFPGQFGGGRGGANRGTSHQSLGGGGGALAYANNVMVTPGEQINIQVGDGRGGQGASTNLYSRPGGMGAVRIIWGEGRAFPNTNADLASSIAGETTI